MGGGAGLVLCTANASRLRAGLNGILGPHQFSAEEAIVLRSQFSVLSSQLQPRSFSNASSRRPASFPPGPGISSQLFFDTLGLKSLFLLTCRDSIRVNVCKILSGKDLELKSCDIRT